MRRPRAPWPPLTASPTFLFGRFFRPWGGAADLDDRLDLHRDRVGQRSHAYGGAGVLALVAEHLDEQVRAAVDDLRLVAELGRAVHHAEQLHHAAHAVEAAELGLHHREQREPDRARVLVALFHAELGAELALHRARALAGEKQQVAGAHRQPRSEEHTSELQSLAYLVCRLL